MTDNADGRLVDECTWRRETTSLIDFVAVDESNRRDCRSTDRLQFNTLRDKRTGDENRPLFNFLLTFGGLVSRGIGERCSGKYAGRDESCSV